MKIYKSRLNRIEQEQLLQKTVGKFNYTINNKAYRRPTPQENVSPKDGAKPGTFLCKLEKLNERIKVFRQTFYFREPNFDIKTDFTEAQLNKRRSKLLKQRLDNNAMDMRLCGNLDGEFTLNDGPNSDHFKKKK